MSLSNFFNIGLSGSYNNIFSTSGCFGSCGYEDTMAGYQVANAAMGAVGSIFSAIMANKQSQPETPSTEDQIAKIDEQIRELRNIDPEDEISETYQNNIDNAKEAQSTATSKLSALNTELADLESLEGTENAPANISTQIQDKKNEIELVKGQLETLNGDENTKDSVKYHEKQKADAIAAKEAEIQEKIDKLQKQKAALQESADDETLDKADGANWKKTSQEDFDKKWNADGTPKEGEEFTKGDMRYAIAMFRNAQTETDKEKWANTIDTIYQDFMNNNMKNITSDFKAARKIVDEYVTKK